MPRARYRAKITLTYRPLDILKFRNLLKPKIRQQVSLNTLDRFRLKRVLNTVKGGNNAAYRDGGHQNNGGEPWQQLNPKTVDIKRKLRVPFPSKPLLRTTRMAFSSRVKAFAAKIVDASGWVRLTLDILMTNSRNYSGYHQTGTKRMPKRPLFHISTSDGKIRRAGTAHAAAVVVRG